MAATLDDLLRELKAIRANSTSPRATRAGAPTTSMTPTQLRDYEETLNRIDKLLNKNHEYFKKERELQKQIIETKQKRVELEDAITGKSSKSVDVAEEELKTAERKLQSLEELVKNLREAEQAAEDLSGSFSSIFSGKAPDLKGMLDPKNIQGLAKNFNKVAAAQMLSQMASKAAVAALFEYTRAIVNLALELDESEVAFMKATGANRDFARSITESLQETRKFGATAKETADAASELFTTFTDFSIVSEDVRENLIETSTVLARMGISNQDFAKSIQTSTKALGMSADQAAQNMLNLEKFAENLGVAPQQLAADFAGAGDMLAKMGSQGTKAFKDLAIVAKTTGMQMESILSITNRFDTFEGAADMAGKLNAALGGNFVNAMDLMMATNPAERFEMIRDSILDAGLSFDEMSYYQKNFYKESLGLSDVNELALLMSGNIDLMDGAVQQSEQSMIDAAKRARDLQTVQEKLQTAFAQLIPIIIPLVDAFSEMAGFVADNIDVIKPLIGVLAIVFGLISGPTGVGGVAGLTLGFGLLFDSAETGNEQLTLLGELFKGITSSFGEVLKIIKPIGTKLSELFQSIADNEETMQKLSDGFRFIGKMMGYAIIGPLGYITVAFMKLAELIFETPFNPPNFLQGLIQIGEAFVNIANSAMDILNPFSAVERAIMDIGRTFSSILGGVTSFFTAITDPAGVENISRIAKAISEVKPVPAAAFTAAMTATAGAQTASAVGAAVTGATEMVNNIVFGGTGTSGGNQQITVNLMLDRDKLATVVQEINGEQARKAIQGRQ